MIKTPKPYPEVYEERLCLFLDILGFKSHVDGSEKSPDKQTKSTYHPLTVAGLYSALESIDRVMNDDVEGINTTRVVTQFSDSIVVSYKLEESSALYYMLYDIYLLQINLISRGILVRGAITAGKLIHDKKVVFGPALNESVEFEKIAMHPRVILSQEIIELGKSKHAAHHSSNDEEKYIKSLLKRDFDGMFYIDYFSVSPNEFDEDWHGLLDHMMVLRELIKRLSHLTRSSSLKLKYSWMRQKFNDVSIPLEKSKYSTFNNLDVPSEHLERIKLVSPFA